MIRPNIPRRRGFLIIEILVTIGLLVFVFAAAGQLFRACILASYDSGNAANQSSRLDSALQILRRDVWQSATMQVADPQSLELSTADDQKISWRIGDEAIVRTGPDAKITRWNGIKLKLQFAQDGPTLLISHAGPPIEQPISLVSQLMLARTP